MSAYLPALAALVGALVYALVPQAKISELGRLTFGAGMLAQLLAFTGHMVKLFGNP